MFSAIGNVLVAAVAIGSVLVTCLLVFSTIGNVVFAAVGIGTFLLACLLCAIPMRSGVRWSIAFAGPVVALISLLVGKSLDTCSGECIGTIVWQAFLGVATAGWVLGFAAVGVARVLEQPDQLVE
jgi:hypothetical protein